MFPQVGFHFIKLKVTKLKFLCSITPNHVNYICNSIYNYIYIIYMLFSIYVFFPY